MDNLCTCVCHSDPLQKHCEGLSCIPCCSVCPECHLMIVLGKMREHRLLVHGTNLPPASSESIDRLKQAINSLRDALRDEIYNS
jgi:hypothetical protein